MVLSIEYNCIQIDFGCTVINIHKTDSYTRVAK